MTSDKITAPKNPMVNKTERKPSNGFMLLLSAPARRALENNGITTLEKLSNYSEREIMKFHGLGKSSLPVLRTALAEKGFTFNK